MVLLITVRSGLVKAGNVEILKSQAAQRREFFSEMAKERRDLRDSQAKKLSELVERHRAERDQYLKQAHSADERAAFFRQQRQDMNKLKTEQQLELRILKQSLKERAEIFHKAQKLQSKQLMQK